MKKRINLIVKQKKYQHLERIFQSLRAAVIFVFIVFFINSLVYFFILYNQKAKIKTLESQKKDLLTYILQNKEIEAKFVFFNNKEKSITTILKNDVNFYPYYNLLVESLKASSPPATLENVTIDKSKATEFTLSFPQYSSLLVFFKFIESDIFLKNFTELHLVSLSNKANKSGDISMNFKGKFIELK